MVTEVLQLEPETNTAAEQRNIVRAAGVLGAATMLSRIMGMVRDMVVSHLFGAGFATDAFFAAFQIPNMMRRFFAEGALTSAFIPVFSRTLNKQGAGDARALANSCFTLLVIIMTLITLAGILGAPFLLGFMFPGFHLLNGKFELTVLLSRIMFPYLFLISLVALCMGVLNTVRHFFTPAISTVFLNVSMILAAVVLRNYFEEPITALAVGVLLGGVIQLALQLPVLWAKGYAPRLNFRFDHPELRRMALLLFPSVVGVGVYYLNITVSAILASLLPQGSVSYLYYAQRLFEFPQGIFTVSVAQAVLPSMSRQAAEGDLEGVKDSINFGLRLTLIITIPAMAGLMIGSTPIFSFLFMGGVFDYATAVNSGQALLYYALGLVWVAMTRVLAPAFYALGDTRTPVICAFLTFVLNLGFSMLLIGPLRHGGLALATSIAACGNMLMLLWLLRRKIGPFGGGKIALCALKSSLASLPMAVVVSFLCRQGRWMLMGHHAEKGAVLSGAIAAGVVVYYLGAWLLRTGEVFDVLNVVAGKIGLNSRSSR